MPPAASAARSARSVAPPEPSAWRPFDMQKHGNPPESTGPDEGRVSRRALLGTGWCGFLLAIVGPAVANIRFLFPNVVYEGPTLLKVGRPEDFAPGTIAVLEEQRLFIIRDPEGFR